MVKGVGAVRGHNITPSYCPWGSNFLLSHPKHSLRRGIMCQNYLRCNMSRVLGDNPVKSV